MDQLHNSLAAKIRQGASKGSAAAEATSNEWAVHSNYHHATYKGMVRRGCTWDHPKRGNLDWPEELAEPVYKTFGKNWRDLFGTILPQQASHVKSKLQEAMKTLHEGIQRDVVQGGCRHKAEVVALQDGLDFSSSAFSRSLVLIWFLLLIWFSLLICVVHTPRATCTALICCDWYLDGSDSNTHHKACVLLQCMCYPRFGFYACESEDAQC